jgi:hypothetical protein
LGYCDPLEISRDQEPRLGKSYRNWIRVFSRNGVRGYAPDKSRPQPAGHRARYGADFGRFEEAELGLTVALEKSAHPDHSWIVCETVPHRIKKSLSDLDGTDAYIHGGTVAGVFRELGNAFVGTSRQPTVAEMSQIYRLLRAQFRSVLKKSGAKDAFNARVFKELCVRASTAADELTT